MASGGRAWCVLLVVRMVVFFLRGEGQAHKVTAHKVEGSQVQSVGDDRVPSVEHLR